MPSKNKRVLLHACCGICSGYPTEFLKSTGFEPLVYFYNPNIDTEEEFNRRLDAQRIICKAFDVKLLVEPYLHKEFLNYIKGLEFEPERGKRCEKCIELRLKKAAKTAKDNGINYFTTSLVISPHKNYEKISSEGQKIAEEYGIEYLAFNFRKNDGFLKTNHISKELKLYRQNYCGCEFAKSHLRVV